MSTTLGGTSDLSFGERSWSRIHCIVFRFVCIYLVLYLADTWLGTIPGLSWLATLVDRSWQALGVWTGAHVLHINSAIDLHTLGTGSGDTLIEYIRVLCEAVITITGAFVWTILDSKRQEYVTLDRWLRVFVRYALAFTMLGYGMAKVFPGQFGPGTLPLDRMLEPYGHSSPMGLLWTFMGYSRPYTIFCGSVEAIGGVLLFWRRTTMLGALI